ncbi:MAG: glycosyl hydrolase family 30, partial [Bacteroidota bacterium]|nr:glycosyl hydrolase family 30 [Bacteroidota bacterium]MDX5430280.1 glycosyl hydrolase family 30 [Bacteroidota bacterium]MDX5469041.1 glycosyl hydrolase family 30 [Bacteroidota bacterium]
MKVPLLISGLTLFLMACDSEKNRSVKVYQTSAGGDKLKLLETVQGEEATSIIRLNPKQTFQTILGFGGSFTESSAYLLQRLSEEKRNEVIEAYFGEAGARYSLTRTHMNSCDFSLDHYSYAPLAGDTSLEHFSIQRDREALIPMIQQAQQKSKEGFKIISSPWTAP